MVSVQDLRELVEVKDIELSSKALKKEGTEDIDDYIRSMVADEFKQQMASSNYFPTRLDPNIYDIGTLYNMTPMLSYLESKGQRAAYDTTEVEYIQFTSGFSGEWVGETEDTSGAGTATTGTATASMKYLALPISMSDMIGKGASSSARAQLFAFAQEALREEYNQTIVSGSSSGTDEFDGLNTLITANGTRTNKSAAAITVADLNTGETVMRESKKTPPTVVLTSNYVVDQLKQDMMATQRYVNTTDTTAGVTVPAYASNTGEIPVIADPNMTTTDNQRDLVMFNERHVFIKDFMTPAYIAEGKSKPFASSGWLGQVSIMYDVAPTLSYQIYNID